MKKVIIISVVLIITLFFALNYHFILHDDGLWTLKKTKMSFKYTFVNARGAVNKAKIIVNPTLVEAGIRNLVSGTGKNIKNPGKEIKKGIKDKVEKW